MTISKRERYIAIAAIVTVAALVVDRYLLGPLIQGESQLAEQKHHIEKEIERATAIIGQKDAAEARWQRMIADGLSRNAADTESVLLHAIREWSQDAGLNLTSVRPERPIQKKGQPPEVLAQVVGTGTMNAVARFLWRLQTAPQPVRVVELQIAARREGMDDLSLQMRLSSLYLPGDSKPAARTANSTGDNEI